MRLYLKRAIAVLLLDSGLALVIAQRVLLGLLVLAISLVVIAWAFVASDPKLLALWRRENADDTSS